MGVDGERERDEPLTGLDEEDAQVWALRETGGEDAAGGAWGG